MSVDVNVSSGRAMGREAPHVTDARDPAMIARAIDHVVEKYSPRGTQIGWLMIASIFIESWDLYSIAFILIFLSQIFHPSAWLLGLTGAATQGGAVIGALAGGWLTDRVGGASSSSARQRKWIRTFATT